MTDSPPNYRMRERDLHCCHNCNRSRSNIWGIACEAFCNDGIYFTVDDEYVCDIWRAWE